VQRNERRTALCVGYNLQVIQSRRSFDEKAGKSGKPPQQAGMYKGMKSLPGYVACGGRDNWDFREILHRMAPEVWHYSCCNRPHPVAVHFRSQGGLDSDSSGMKLAGLWRIVGCLAPSFLEMADEGTAYGVVVGSGGSSSSQSVDRQSE
jgi:hypothetical protein